MTIASMVTMARIALIPFFLVAVHYDWGGGIVGLVIFVVASLTDNVDGFIARNFNQITVFGNFLDTTADKLLITAAILHLVSVSQIPVWVAAVVIFRELIIMGLKMIASSGGTIISAGTLGKLKALIQTLVIVILLSPLAAISLGGIISLGTLGVWLMAAITVYSGLDYLWKYRKLLNPKV